MIDPRVIAILVAAVFAAGSWLGFRMGKADGDREVRRMYEAAAKVVRKRESDGATEQSRLLERIADLERRPVRRVYACPDPVPGAAPVSGAPSGPEGAGGTRLDLTPALLNCERRLLQLDALTRWHDAAQD
jgi:hypothetical protein